MNILYARSKGGLCVYKDQIRYSTCLWDLRKILVYTLSPLLFILSPLGPKSPFSTWMWEELILWHFIPWNSLFTCDYNFSVQWLLSDRPDKDQSSSWILHVRSMYSILWPRRLIGHIENPTNHKSMFLLHYLLNSSYSHSWIFCFSL